MQGVSQNPSEAALRYTRWVEKQEAVCVFKQLLPAVCASLDDIASWPDGASGKALLFSASLNDAFVVALEVLVSVLEVTKPLSVRLQRATEDIHNASESVRDCITTLQGMRTDEIFKKIFENAKQQHGGTVEIPRINARQRNSENHPAESAEEYHRRSMYFQIFGRLFRATTREVHCAQCDCLWPKHLATCLRHRR